MSTVRMTITGIEDVQANLRTWLSEKTKQIDEATQGAGLDTEAGAKQRAPVDTGRSRAAYQYEDMGTGHCRVFNPVKYVIFVELGTYKMPARPALFPSFAEGSKNLDRELRGILSS